MVAELTDMNRNLMMSIDIVPVPTDEAVREAESRLLGVETNITNWQRRQNSNNNFSATVPYDMEQQKKEFQYELTKNRLVFQVMQESTATFYPGKQNPLYQDLEEMDHSKENAFTVTMEQMKSMRFIQNYRDEFLELNEKEKRGTFSWENLDLAVITNSDYIMEKMLQETELSNISGSYLSDHKKAMNQGIPLDFKKNKIFFGYIRRKNDETDELMDEFLEFLAEKLKGKTVNERTEE